jgi:transposase
VELLDHNRERIIHAFQDAVLELLDWRSIVYYGDMAKLAKYGYSRDHRPDERQLTLGAAMLGRPMTCR